MINPTPFQRKPFFVEAVCVTEENMAEAAEWCKGTVRQYVPKGRNMPNPGWTSYIKVQVARPLHERQTMAVPGDWILKVGSGFKVFTPKAFQLSFEPVNQTVDQATYDHFDRTYIPQQNPFMKM